ncbi:inhibitor of nuclear factor kappa-B kinase subunit alpha-like, partial [Paramuricea clavata]
MAERRKIGDWIESGYLGSGTFGMVKLWHNEVTKAKIALKTCRNDPPLSEKNRERWRQEVEFLKRIKHPNIIETRPLPEELVEEGRRMKFLPALCMEYCEGGDLRKTLSTTENCCGLKETMIIRVCEDIANAIECLHKENIAHRDLKPENIVICQSGSKNIYKVIDLGYAKQADQAGLWHSFVGTQYYLAPEILTGQKYTLKVDLWSFGILLYECCTGNRPFPGHCQELYESMRSKEQQFIAVTFEDENGTNVRARQKLVFSNNGQDMLVYRDKLPEVNRLNCVLQRKFEKLFRLLLDGNPSRRGSCETDAGTRSWRDCVDEIRNTKVIEVFCIDLYKQFAYELTSNFSLKELQSLLEKDTGIPSEHQELFTHDGSDLTSLSSATACLTAFMFNKAFNPKLELRYKHELPSILLKMLEDPEAFSKRSTKRHMEVYKHSVFFIHRQIENNKCLIRGLKALVIRLLKWSRQEFTVRSETVGQRVTELRSVFSFFDQSLRTDLKNYESKCSTFKNGVTRDMPDFEAWRRVDINNILREASEIFKRKSELQNKIATMKNNERVSKTPERSMQQLTQRAKEIQSRYENMKASMRNQPGMKKPEDKSSCWKDKIGTVRDTIKMILKEVEKINEEFYHFLRELFILRQELENFIPTLKGLETKTIELGGKIREWQQSRQEQIWKLLSRSNDKEEKAEKDQASSQQRPAVNPRR